MITISYKLAAALIALIVWFAWKPKNARNIHAEDQHVRIASLVIVVSILLWTFLGLYLGIYGSNTQMSLYVQKDRVVENVCLQAILLAIFWGGSFVNPHTHGDSSGGYGGHGGHGGYGVSGGYGDSGDSGDCGDAGDC